MMGQFKPYPAYKDSSVPWLGKVPEHWEVRRLKAAVAHINEQTHANNPDDLCIALEHVESWTGRLRLSSGDIQFDSQVKRFRAGDVLFGKLRPYLAKVVRPKQSGVCVGEFFVLRAKPDIASRYLEVVLRSVIFIDFVNSSTYGARMPRAEWAFVGAILFPLPPLPEQTAIVRFLDYMDRRIRGVIRARQQQIKLLEEYKQALIHQAVTGQIDVRTGKPYPAYKDSGVEWLGKVPEHWEVVPLKRIVLGRLKYGANAAAEFSTPSWPRYIRITDFDENGGLRENTFRSLPPDVAKEYLLHPGDILLARSGATVGKSFLVGPSTGLACYASYLIRVRPNPARIIADFLFAFLQSHAFSEWRSAAFIVATIENISADKYGDLPVPIPTLEEQEFVVKWLKQRFIKIDAAIAAARREIELLREYRERLIADVVTGKVDVREVAAQLPEEPPEEAELGSADEIETGEAEGEATNDAVAAEAVSQEEVEA